MTTWLQDPRPGATCAIIGEVAQAHDGSLGMAHAFIDAIAAVGADAVKFQTHIAAAESTAEEPWRTRFSRQDDSRLDYWRRMEFRPEQWLELKTHAESRGMVFLSSPFSIEAFELLQRLGVAIWKVPSGEISCAPLVEAIAATRQPVMLSTGMSPQGEVDAAVAAFQRQGCALAIMQCSSMYPCPPEAVGLNLLEAFRARYGGAVGLSDHSGTIYPALAAVTLGAEVVEVHVTLSRDMFGPDVPASVTTTELRSITEGNRFIGRMRAHPVDKEIVPDAIQPLRAIFMKSVVARAPIEAGTVLGLAHLTAKKPAGGLAPERMGELLGRRLRRAIPRDGRILPEDVE